jgi:hypothetical protein
LAAPHTVWHPARVAWYGTQSKAVAWVRGVALWSTPGHDPVRRRWVLVRYETEHLPAVTRDLPADPTLALFAQWDAEDAQMTPEEVTEAQRDADEFFRRMNTERARAGARLLYP